MKKCTPGSSLSHPMESTLLEAVSSSTTSMLWTATFLARRPVEHALVVAVDVDDLTMAGSSNQAILHFKGRLQDPLCIKDLGELHWLLGLRLRGVEISD